MMDYSFLDRQAREAREERERQSLAVWAVLSIVVAVSLGAGLLVGMSVGYSDAKVLAKLECGK